MRVPTAFENLRKGAILLASIGHEAATKICKHLPREVVRGLAEEVARLGSIEAGEQTEVLDEFVAASRRIMSLGGTEYARSLLAEATGESVSFDGEFSSESEQLRALADSEPHVLWRNIQNETPQIIAVIISQVPAAKAAEILQFMNEEKRGEVAYRAAKLNPLAPGALEVLAECIEGKVVRPEASEQETTTSGLEFLLQMLEHVDRTSEKEILTVLGNINEEFAEQVNDRLVTFETVLMLEEKALQAVLRGVEISSLAVALRGLPDRQKQQVMQNLSTRAQEALTEEMEMLGPVKVADVDAAQKQIANLARELDEVGEIALRHEEEEYIQ